MTRSERPSAGDVRDLGPAWLALGSSSLLLGVLRKGRDARLLGGEGVAGDVAAPPLDEAGLAAASRIAAAVRRAARRSPWRSDCYPQALAARRLLRRAGVPHVVSFGLRRSDDGEMVAHAWVRAGDVPVTGGDGAGYVTVRSFAWSPAGARTERRAYTCYGLVLDSTIELPGLEHAPGRSGAADVTIVEASTPEPPDGAVEVLPGLWTAGGAVWVVVPEVGRFEARDGWHVTFERHPGASDGDVRIFLLGTVLGAVAWQRGHLVLHGNAFRVGGSAVVVVGHSGAGKSTLAAELARRGFDVLSDDVVPVDAEGRALPGYPRVKLWQDAVASLGLDGSGLQRITPAHDKFHVPIVRGPLTALPVSAVYVLEREDRDDLVLEPVTGARCFEELRTHTYRRELAADAEAARRHLHQCAALAARARIVRVRRPAATMTAPATADAVLADLGVGPAAADDPTDADMEVTR